MRFSIYLKILTTSVLTSAVIVSALTVYAYLDSYRELETKFALTLKHIAINGAAMIPGEDHADIRAKGDEKTPEFRRVRSVLRRIMGINYLTHDTIYTFRAVDEHRLAFAVMLHAKPFVGDVYSIPKANRKAYRMVLRGRPAATAIYSDEHGRWVSGLAPIKDKAGRITGILQVDYRVDRFVEELFSRTNRHILIGALVMLVGIAAGLWIAHSISTPVKKLTRASLAVRDGNYDERVHIDSNDEIRELSEIFNQMIESIRYSRSELRDLVLNLEDKVDERTSELRRSLEDVRGLKIKQDSDYYLASLLVEPLAANRARSKRVQVEFLTLQMKSFRFKNWDAEIGGDICVSDNIVLDGRAYTLFLNGDAMGKSLQGSAGALILGAVFRAIAARNQGDSSATGRRRDDLPRPEQWLRDAFIEIQNVFASFEGFMMTTLVMGLVEEEQGLLYFINASHPPPVLLRNGNANLIKSEVTFHRPGEKAVRGDIFVQTLELRSKDVLIIGSDGRDDLILGRDENGDALMNEDEGMFLMVTSECHGDLHCILAALKEKGELADDLSLLRIQYD